ncbi:DUF4252 domain-containing protein [Rufibacter roseus]|uniref:DUF4252 domain-containing protein n=1 Tax=Rufibacter roseus TaxID=1567108 RepID=UPI0013730707
MALISFIVIQACSSTRNLPPAQTTTEFYQKYRNEAGFKGTSLPVGLVTRFLSKDADTTLQAALANVTSIRVLTFAPTNRRSARLLENGLTQELDQILQKSNYAAVPVLQNSQESLQFRMRQENGMVQEIVGHRNIGSSFMMLQVNGRFTPQQVQQMMQKIDPEALVPLIQ